MSNGGQLEVNVRLDLEFNLVSLIKKIMYECIDY